MSGEFTNIEGVLAEAQNQNYYDLLIKQLSKDLMRVGVVQVSEMPCAPIDLKVWLENVLLELIKYDFDSYLQLLYVVDVSEKEMRNLTASLPEEMVEDVVFLILKREWQKYGLEVNSEKRHPWVGINTFIGVMKDVKSGSHCCSTISKTAPKYKAGYQ